MKKAKGSQAQYFGVCSSRLWQYIFEQGNQLVKEYLLCIHKIKSSIPRKSSLEDHILGDVNHQYQKP